MRNSARRWRIIKNAKILWSYINPFSTGIFWKIGIEKQAKHRLLTVISQKLGRIQSQNWNFRKVNSISSIQRCLLPVLPTWVGLFLHVFCTLYLQPPVPLPGARSAQRNKHFLILQRVRNCSSPISPYK